MSTSAATADWEALEDKYYRKVLLYSGIFQDSYNLDDYIIVGAPCSGAIAVYRDESKIINLRGGNTPKPSIEIFSSAGSPIRHLSIDKTSIRGVGWSDDEKLLVVTEDGTVRCYYDLQGDFTQFSLGHGAEEIGVNQVRFWSSGFVALLNNNLLVAVSGYEEPRPRPLADPTPFIVDSTVHAWGLIPPAYTLSRHVEVLLSTGATILVVDASEVQDQVLQNGPFTHVSVSPNGRYIALYTFEGKLWVIKADFQDKLSEYDPVMGNEQPKSVVWCGNDSVVVAWEEELHMVGPRGTALTHYYDSRLHLVPDVDCVRVITVERCEMLQKVPDVTEDTFKIGSTSPAAILLDAVEQLEKKSPKADDNIQLIRPQLAEAVDACIKAAGYEYSVHWQKQLLKAASFGKSVLELYSSDAFVDMCETLRTLNAVRFYEVGAPLTYDQFIRLTPEKLIQRLVNRQLHLLALRISTHLRLPAEMIYIHWACMKVRHSTDDEDSICRLIVAKLKGKRGIGFEEIARTAYDEGRGRLATQLLNHEPQAGRQVPLLLSMEEDEIALDKAVESGDTDLVYFVLLHLKKKVPLHTFFQLVSARPIAAALVEASAKQTDPELLKDFYYQEDRRAESAHIILREAITAPDLQQRLEKLKIAANLLADEKTHSLEAQALSEKLKLLGLQEQYERDSPGERFMGLPLNETAFRLIRIGDEARASSLKSTFKIPDKRFTWLRLRALVAKRDWGLIEEEANKKKSAIPWEAWFEECLTAGSPRTAAVFVAKCRERDRVGLYGRCGMWTRAAEEAVRLKDLKSLEEIVTRVTGREREVVERMIQGLRGR